VTRRAVVVALCAVLWPFVVGSAQGVTTGVVSGRIVDESGSPVVGASISVVNTATGAASRTLAARDGRYLVTGLDVGGPYSVTARHPGYQSQMRDGQVLTLSQNLTLDFRLERQTIILSTVSVTTETDPILSPDRTGAATIISDSALRRLPTLDRTFTDFVALSPEVSDAGPGLSGAGVNNRLNNILIDGSSENDLFGLGDTGQPGGQARGKSIGLESVREYQVLLAPFDVQQGNFGGVLVNAVTRGGTNEMHGSAFFASRSERLARNVDYVRDQEYSQRQFGFSIGGPILRDRVHFFVAPEFQRRYEPATGPYLGAVAGLGALFLYELAVHERSGLVLPDFDHAPALVRLAAFVAAGVVTGFLARRLRLMLAQSLSMLEELSDIAYGRVDWAALDRARAQDASPDGV